MGEGRIAMEYDTMKVRKVQCQVGFGGSMQRVEEERCLFNRERGGGGGEVYYITNGNWRGKDNLLSRHGGADQS